MLALNTPSLISIPSTQYVLILTLSNPEYYQVWPTDQKNKWKYLRYNMRIECICLCVTFILSNLWEPIFN